MSYEWWVLQAAKLLKTQNLKLKTKNGGRCKQRPPFTFIRLRNTEKTIILALIWALFLQNRKPDMPLAAGSRWLEQLNRLSGFMQAVFQQAVELSGICEFCRRLVGKVTSCGQRSARPQRSDATGSRVEEHLWLRNEWMIEWRYWKLKLMKMPDFTFGKLSLDFTLPRFGHIFD